VFALKMGALSVTSSAATRLTNRPGWREKIFEPPHSGVAELNSSADDFDVQLSADGQEVFFASNRNSINYRIWRSLVTCP
jgi:hypothetical protein